MPFQPRAEETLLLDGVTYRVAAHPAAPAMPYGQEGRQATVYQLIADGDVQALKVFKARYRVPALVALTERLAPLATLPGLAVCRRTVLTPQRHTALLRQYPDLTYAVLMRWISGPTWMETLLDRRALTPEESLALAHTLAETLAAMEQRGVAHCDLSAPNLLLPALQSSAISRQLSETAGSNSAIELVDVEQAHGPDLSRPQTVPAGSAGYAHRTASAGLWEPDADRFAGAILLAEMLGWCDPQVRAAAWGESFFDPAEMQQPGDRARRLTAALHARWSAPLAQLFTHAWDSPTLADCPTFGEWLISLPEQVPQIATAGETKLPISSRPARINASPTNQVVRTLAELGQELQAVENYDGALRCYQRALGAGSCEE